MFFFGFSRFLVLENLENPKNFFFFFFWLIFPVFIEQSKKHHDFFLDFRWFSSKNPKKPIAFFDFQSFCFWKFLKITKNL